MKEQTENFIEYLLSLDLDYMEEEAKQNLIYDINDIVLSLEAFIDDYKEASKINELQPNKRVYANKKRPNKRVINFVEMSEKKKKKKKSLKEMLANKKIPNKRYILEKDDRLKLKAKVLQDSIDWWEEKMNEAFSRLDSWEEKEEGFDFIFESDEELQEIITEIEFLSARGQIENKLSQELEKEIDDFVKECKGLI